MIKGKDFFNQDLENNHKEKKLINQTTPKEIVKKMNRQSTDWKKIFGKLI